MVRPQYSHSVVSVRNNSPGDFEPDSERGADHVVCVENMKDFTSAFLFSVETQHTIG